MSIRVSVVVPTYKRPQLLRSCLNALARQDFPLDAYEVIVVDDAVSEETRALVEKFSGEIKVKMTEIRYAVATDTQGPAAARNLGWRMAHGQIIAFTDDDCLPELGWLKEGVAAIDSGFDAVSGQMIVPISNPPTDYEKNIARLAEGEFVTANCFIRRCVLESCQGFDERFRMAWREDSDLHFRILDLSYRHGRAPNARVVHPVRQAPWGVSIKEQRKSMFNALLYKKYPALYRARIQAHAPWNYYAIVLSFLGLLAATLSGYKILAGGLGLLWLGLTLHFTFKRLRQTKRTFGHILEMLYTSIVIPPLSIFWRLYGAVHFRVPFF